MGKNSSLNYDVVGIVEMRQPLCDSQFRGKKNKDEKKNTATK